jgi:hypothetical protein
VCALAADDRPGAGRPGRGWLRAPVIALAGVGSVFCLLYAEMFIIDNSCLWYTGVHVLTVAHYAVIRFGTAALDIDKSRLVEANIKKLVENNSSTRR